MRSFASDVRPCGAWRSGNGGTSLARSVRRRRGWRCLRCPRHWKDRLLSRLRGRGGEEGEKEGVAQKASGGRTWRTCGVGGCVYRTKHGTVLKSHKAAIHSIDIEWHDCPELGVRSRRAASSSTEPWCTILALLGTSALSLTARTRRRRRATSRCTESTCMASALLGMLALSLGASTRRRWRAPLSSTGPTCTLLTLVVL